MYLTFFSEFWFNRIKRDLVLFLKIKFNISFDLVIIKITKLLYTQLL